MYKYILILCLVFVVGCSTPVKRIETIEKSVDRVCLCKPNPPPLKIEEPKWEIVFKDDTPYFALNEEEWKKTNIMTQKIQSHILKLKDLLKEYRDYYEPRGEKSKTRD